MRRTGGLADTVRDVDDGGDGNGYVFDGTDDGSLHQALDRAIQHYLAKPESWAQLRSRNMAEHVGWQKSGGAYVDLYNQIAEP